MIFFFSLDYTSLSCSTSKIDSANTLIFLTYRFATKFHTLLQRNCLKPNITNVREFICTADVFLFPSYLINRFLRNRFFYEAIIEIEKAVKDDAIYLNIFKLLNFDTNFSADPVRKRRRLFNVCRLNLNSAGPVTIMDNVINRLSLP